MQLTYNGMSLGISKIVLLPNDGKNGVIRSSENELRKRPCSWISAHLLNLEDKKRDRSDSCGRPVEREPSVLKGLEARLYDACRMSRN